MERAEVPLSDINPALLADARKVKEYIAGVMGFAAEERPAYDESEVLDIPGAISLEWTWEKDEAFMCLITDFVDDKITYGLHVGRKNTEDWTFSLRHLGELYPNMVEMAKELFEKIAVE